MTIFADLVVTNGNVITLDHTTPRASAFAVRDEKIVFIGADADAARLAGPHTKRIDLHGKTVTPGFIDSHIHLLMYGTNLLRQADLVGVADVEELLARMAQHADHYDGPWLQGRGFDQDKMTGKIFPTRADLDKVSTTRPIIVTRICGHALVVNSAALALVTKQEAAAGDVDTGLFTETAMTPFYRLIPDLSEAEQETAAQRAAAEALKTGITAVGTLLDVPQQMGAYARLRRKGKLPLRVVGMPPYASIDGLHERGVNTTFGDAWLQFGAAKFFSDGSLGAHTALMAAPYSDEDRPENRGVRIYPPDDLKAKVTDAHKKGFQVAIHAIGDQANTESLDAIFNALGPDGDNDFHRHRIEHASILNPADMARMAARRIVAVVQPQFVASDSWTGERVGAERVNWAYPFKSMLDAGIPLALSSDCPVEKLDAFACLSAAVGRADWSPQQKLTPYEALKSYCLGSAYALHSEKRIGSLEVGKLADFVVLSGDITRMDAEHIRKSLVERVFIGGIEVASSKRNERF